jgi:hypothetical protein
MANDTTELSPRTFWNFAREFSSVSRQGPRATECPCRSPASNGSSCLAISNVTSQVISVLHHYGPAGTLTSGIAP